MTQDTANPTKQDDEDQEEDVVNDLVQDQEIKPEDVSPEDRRELNEEVGDHGNERIPRPSEDGDADADLDEREVAHDEHDNR